MVRQRAHGRTCDWGGGGTWHWAAGHRHCLHCHLLSLRKAIDDVFLIPKQEGQINNRRSRRKVYHDDGLLVNDGLLLLLSQNRVLGFWRKEKDTVNRADWQKSCWMRFFVFSCFFSRLIRTRCYRSHSSNRRRHHTSHRKDSHSCKHRNTHISVLSHFNNVCFTPHANDVWSYWCFPSVRVCWCPMTKFTRQCTISILHGYVKVLKIVCHFFCNVRANEKCSLSNKKALSQYNVKYHQKQQRKFMPIKKLECIIITDQYQVFTKLWKRSDYSHRSLY